MRIYTMPQWPVYCHKFGFVCFTTKYSTRACMHNFLFIEYFQSFIAHPHGTALPNEVFIVGFISVKAASIDSSWHAGSSRLRCELKVQHSQQASPSVCTARERVAC